MQDALYPQPDPTIQQEHEPQSPPARPEAGAPNRRSPEHPQKTMAADQTDTPSSTETATVGLQDAEPASPLPAWAPPTMMLMGVALLTWLMLRSFVRRGRSPDQPSDPRERIEAIRRQAGARAQVDSFSADAQELTQRLAAQLDAKAARIQLLLDDAEEAVRRLERAKRTLDSAPPRPTHEAPDKADANPLSAEVYRLADEGRSTLEIAQKLNQHVGQIELMLALRRA